MTERIKVCHFTSAHDTDDDRIFLKECKSLKSAGYDVSIVGKGDSKTVCGINIFGIGDIPKSRLKRMTNTARLVYAKALSLNCDIYHFHDPELLPYGLKLKRRGKKVIFDSHEDVPAQIKDKKWIPKILRSIISTIYESYETYVVKQIDAVVAATPHIAKMFERRAKRIVVINNYPKLDDIVFQDTPFESRERIICYAGGIDDNRGEKIMIEAMKDADVTLIIAGNHELVEIGGMEKRC